MINGSHCSSRGTFVTPESNFGRFFSRKIHYKKTLKIWKVSGEKKKRVREKERSPFLCFLPVHRIA